MHQQKLFDLSKKKHKALADASALLDGGLTTTEEREAHKQFMAEAATAQSDIDSLTYIASQLGNHAPAMVEEPVLGVSEKQSPRDRRQRLNAAYRHLLRNGYKPGAVEQRDITSLDGAALVAQDFDAAYTAAQTWAGPIATLVKQRRLKVAGIGAPTKFTISDDTASTMTYLPETGNTSGAEAEPSMSSTIPGTDALVTMVKYSFQEADDADDLESLIRDLAFVRAARAVEYALTVGRDSGTNTDLPNSPTGGILANVSAGVIQSAGQLPAGPTYGQLSALAGSVDHSYYAAPSSGFMASPSVFNLLLAQTDATGRPLYPIDPQSGRMIIAGRPLYVNAAMPAYNVASSPVVLFGDFSRAWAYLNGGLQIRILTERFADELMGAAIIYQRIGAAKLLTPAVKALVTAAS